MISLSILSVIDPEYAELNSFCVSQLAYSIVTLFVCTTSLSVPSEGKWQLQCLALLGSYSSN